MDNLNRLLTNPRVAIRRQGLPEVTGNCVVYWMQRAQRGVDNPALDVAIAAANELQKPVAVFFGLHPHYPNANLRHYTFLVEGLKETAERIEARGAAFVFRPYPHHDLIRFCEEVNACLVIGDENPLREPERWRQSAAQKLLVPFWTVDADVVIPTKLFTKDEYAARTLRPKIHRELHRYLLPSENPKARYRWPLKLKPGNTADISCAILNELPLDKRVAGVKDYRGGTTEGLKRLKRFVTNNLTRYDVERNLPTLNATSGLSPYLHFGQISPITIALKVQQADAPLKAKEAYLEELIVRRELAINFVSRNPQYDSLAGCPAWGRQTLAEHARDERSFLYSERELENAETHDALWNAAQIEMIESGQMHGYLRMYWAKKILEWTPSPETAFEIGISLNDRYELDGRDPNGYTGLAWAIGGKHDRPWAPERPIFGLIRYMSSEGCRRKFDVNAYISNWSHK